MSGSVSTNSSRRSGSIGTAASGPTVSASNPTITTNPTLGTQWANSSTGDFYVCTTATADANVWTHVDNAQDSIAPWAYQGENFGYAAGGNGPSDVIDKYSYSSDANATDVGNLLAGIAYASPVGCSSDTYGYALGGASSNVIQKSQFSADGNSTDVGDLAVTRSSAVGTNSATNGYGSSGNIGAAPGVDTVDKFALSSTASATDIGNLTQARTQAGGATDLSGGYGYCVGGGTGNGTRYDIIDRNAFSSDGDSADVGDMLQGSYRGGGASSTTHGYMTGGHNGSGYINVIEKFAFGSSSSGTDVGDIVGNHGSLSGTSATSYGYWAGGGPPGTLNNIEKYSFSSDGNSTDVGDLTVSRRDAAGFHY